MSPHQRVAPLEKGLEIVEQDRSIQGDHVRHVRGVAARTHRRRRHRHRDDIRIAHHPGIVALQRVEHGRVPLERRFEPTSCPQGARDREGGAEQRPREQRRARLDVDEVWIGRQPSRKTARRGWRIREERQGDRAVRRQVIPEYLVDRLPCTPSGERRPSPGRRANPKRARRTSDQAEAHSDQPARPRRSGAVA